MRLLKAFAVAVAVLGGSFSTQSIAQGYPAKPVKLVVPFAAGGTTDILARLYGQRMGTTLGQPLIVENRTGAGTMIGSDYVAKSAADGYTLLLGSPSVWLNPVLYKKVPYKFDDFTPISVVARAPYVMAIPANLGPQNLQEFIVWAKNPANRVSYGILGVGAPSHLVSKLFENVTGVRGVDISYKGTAPVMTDLMGGLIQYYFDAVVTSLPLHRSGKIRVLAVTSEQRSPAATDIPTFKELGYPKMVADTVWGIFAPAGTPRPIINQLSRAAAEAAGFEEMRSRLLREGTVPIASTPEGFSEIIRQDFDMWNEIIKASNIQLE